jgi:hypothetical protein
MRLHLLLAAVVFAGLIGFAGTAKAEIELNDSAKPLEPVVHHAKKTSFFAPQAPLFAEQKEAPAASKTALRLNTSPRFGDKSKD